VRLQGRLKGGLLFVFLEVALPRSTDVPSIDVTVTSPAFADKLAAQVALQVSERERKGESAAGEREREKGGECCR
jgi:hypothetical protein